MLSSKHMGSGWLVHSYQYRKGVLGHRSASFLQSLTTALGLGATAAFIGVAASAAFYYRHTAWYISAAAGPLVDTLVVVCWSRQSTPAALGRAGRVNMPEKTKPKLSPQK